MMNKTQASLFLLTTFLYVSSTSFADVVLTFDQGTVNNFTSINQSYGDNVSAATDGNGYSYDIIAGEGYGLTPNVEVSYTSSSPLALWTTGYGNLTNVMFAGDFSTGYTITLAADPGFEVGLIGFDMASFSSDQTLPGVEVLDDNGTSLANFSNILLSGSSQTNFDFSGSGGLFSESIEISVVLDGTSNADNFGIDNIQIAQRPIAAVPEPATGSVMLLAGIGTIVFRRRRCAL